MRKQLVIMPILALALTSFANAAIPPRLNAFSEGERLVYGKVVQAFRENKLPEAVKQRNLLVKNYPMSVHLGNAFYLTGVLEFQKNRYANAVRDFGIVADRYPLSSKRAAALLAKAKTYELLGLRSQAERLLRILVKDYPGSQESQQAWIELKTAKAGNNKATQR